MRTWLKITEQLNKNTKGLNMSLLNLKKYLLALLLLLLLFHLNHTNQIPYEKVY